MQKKNREISFDRSGENDPSRFKSIKFLSISFFFICIAEITTSDINQDYVSLLFKDPTTLKKYVVTAQADPRGNISIEAVVSYL